MNTLHPNKEENLHCEIPTRIETSTGDGYEVIEESEGTLLIIPNKDTRIVLEDHRNSRNTVRIVVRMKGIK